jgi:hypothetical protein
MLDEIGFVVSAQDKDWNLQFQKLRDYYEKHGHCELFLAVDRLTFTYQYPYLHSTCASPWISGNVQRRYQEDPKLGRWVTRQRTFFRKCKLDHERKRMLDEIGFEFNRKGSAWNLQFEKLREYYEKHGA